MAEVKKTIRVRPWPQGPEGRTQIYLPPAGCHMRLSDDGYWEIVTSDPEITIRIDEIVSPIHYHTNGTN